MMENKEKSVEGIQAQLDEQIEKQAEDILKRTETFKM